VDTTIGHWVKRRRKELGLSQAGLGKLCGCSAASIRKIEADIRRPSVTLAKNLTTQLQFTGAQRDNFMRDIRAPRSRETLAKSVSSAPLTFTNISQSPLPLHGQQSVISAIRRRIINEGGRLLTVTGPPGVGKTSVAMCAAWEMLDDFEDGVFFVTLADVADAEAMFLRIQCIVNPAGFMAGSGQQQRLVEYLRNKHLLLVLDSFEHLIDTSALVAQLLNECAWLSILVTSRASLLVRRERDQPVPLLAAPGPDIVITDPERVCKQYPALALFVENASAVAPDIIWTPAVLSAAGAICRMVEGLPLAIELLAPQCRYFSPQELYARLTDADEGFPGALARVLDYGTRGANDLPERQHSLRAAVGASYILLSSEEQRLFRHLSVFEDRFDEDALRSYDSSFPANGSASLTLHGLIDKSLVRVMQHDGPSRSFSMLRICREFAAEQLLSSGEFDDAHARHADVMLSWALAAEPLLQADPRHSWLDRLQRNISSVRSALLWLSQARAPGADGPTLAAALTPFWLASGCIDEGARWLSLYLRIAEQQKAPGEIHSRLHLACARTAFAQNDLRQTQWHMLHGLSYAAEHDDPIVGTNARLGLAFLALCDGDLNQARDYALSGYATGLKIENPWLCGLACWALGEAAQLSGNQDEARNQLRNSIAALTQVGGYSHIAHIFARLDALERHVEPQSAEATFLAQCLEISKVLGYRGRSTPVTLPGSDRRALATQSGDATR
jgi:predicted ATPase/transcriptional regulator with XRE-family HTH domain